MRTEKITLELEIQVEDKVKYVAVDKNGNLYGYKNKPKCRRIKFTDIGEEYFDSITVTNWRDTLMELPKPETDWSKVPRFTPVMVWDKNKHKLPAHFLHYNPRCVSPFLAICVDNSMGDFENCELIEEESE